MWACLLNRNVFIVNPSIPFVGWLLLASALMPEGEPWVWRAAAAPDPNWHAPPVLIPGAWLVMALAYSVSGIDKLASPSWLDGSALKHVLESPIARPGLFREALLALPAPALRLMSWAALSAEVLFAPLCLTRATRAVAWTATLFLHCGVLIVLNLAELTVGVLMFHALTFDRGWLPVRARNMPVSIPLTASSVACSAITTNVADTFALGKAAPRIMAP